MSSHMETMFCVFSLRRPSSVEKTCIIIICMAAIIKIEATCLSSCNGQTKLFASYPSCDSCKKYVTCLLGQLVTNDCLFGSVYDERFGLCTIFSGTCADFTEYVKGSTTTAASITTSSTGSVILKPSQAGKTLIQNMYVKVLLQPPLCTANASVYKTATVRSKTECGALCNRDLQCWYFRVTAQTCSMYLSKLPPCGQLYKYLG